MKDRFLSDFARDLEFVIPMLRRYARALTADREEADDLVQDCLLRALERQAQFKEGTNLRAWAFTIMHNCFIDGMRKTGGKTIERPLEWFSSRLHTRPQQPHKVALDELGRAIRELPVDQRLVLLLVGLEGFSYEEVAEIVDVPVGTIKSRLSRARAVLMSRLDHETEVPTGGRARGQRTPARPGRLPGQLP